MKYKTIIETDEFDDFEFFEDDNGKYIHGIDAGAVNNEWIPLYFTECEQEPCEMTVEEYRQRMIQAFHNADTDSLIAICVLPTEKEFEHLEWLLKNHYKQEPCEDCISRQATIDAIDKWVKNMGVLIALPANEVTPLFDNIHKLPPVTSQPKIGRWIEHSHETGENWEYSYFECSECHVWEEDDSDYCPNCGAKMEVEG